MRTFLITVPALFLFCLDGWAQSTTNIGTEFWIAFPPNSSIVAVKQLYISSNVSTSGTIESVYPGVNQNFSVTPGIVTQITLPSGITLQGGIEDKGIHITADDPIAVYGLNNQTASTDAFLALPVNALGLDYRILTYSTTIANSGSSLSVVATQNGTALTVFNHQTSSTTNVNLDAGQTYLLEALNLNEDLTGSRVQSNLPVAVYGSVKIGQVPWGCTFADHIVEQMFPCYSWGKNFVTVPLAGRDNSGDVFRILAGEDGTEITINGTVVSTINENDYYETTLAGYNSISTSKATMVAQYAKGQNCSGGLMGDPFMMLILPREQYLTDYTIINVAGVTPFDSHWVNVVAPDYALGTIYQDGTLIPPGAFVPIGTTNFYGAQLSVTQGSHIFNSTFPFGVTVYGWRTVDSYGYPGGGSMSPVATVDSVLLSPDTLYGDLNITNLCLTAHVQNSLSLPVEGILVNIYVTGINPVFGNGFTNTSGDVQFCYTQTGTASGIDHVYAEAFGILSDTSIIYWTYLCNDPTDGGEIGIDQSGCGEFVPLPLNSITLPSGENGTLEYKWQQSVVSSSSGFTDIPGTNNPEFAPGIVTQTTWFRRLARVSCINDWNTAVISNVLEMTFIPPLPVSVILSASDTTVCEGTSVTFTATPVNGGSVPAFQWYVNGLPAGSNSPSYAFAPVNNDAVSCILTSSESCTSGNPATSGTIVMTVYPILPVSVSVSAAANPVCAGTTVVFNAVGVNGGASPSYQWKVNGVIVGTNASSYSYKPLDNDIITCMFTSSWPCPVNNPATSLPYTMTIWPVPSVSFTACFDTVTITGAQPIRLKGGVPNGGSYSGTGVSGGYYDPGIAGTGTHVITYGYSNIYSCSAFAIARIHQLANPPFACGNALTDVRDGKVYPTVTIGGQCWMAANLDYGVQIPEFTHQRDNCVPEKYKPAAGSSQSAVYQWDELMHYDNTPGIQGLCPPGWHVPTQADWLGLLNVFQGQGFAASPLLSTGYSGFNALLTGARHQNMQWDFQDFATFFWSSTPHGLYKAWSYGMNEFDPSVSFYPSLRSNAFSLRCIRN